MPAGWRWNRVGSIAAHIDEGGAARRLRFRCYRYGTGDQLVEGSVPTALVDPTLMLMSLREIGLN